MKHTTDPSKRPLGQIVLLVAFGAFFIGNICTLDQNAPNTIQYILMAVSFIMAVMIFFLYEPYTVLLVTLTEEQKIIVRKEGIQGLMTEEDKHHTKSVSLLARSKNGKRSGLVRFVHDKFDYLQTPEATQLLLMDKLCIGYKLPFKLAPDDIFVDITFNLDDLTVDFTPALALG